MFTRLWLFLAILIPSASAQVGSPSQQDVFFYLDFYRTTTAARSVSVDFNNASIVSSKAITQAGFQVESFARPMKPGVLYPLTVARGTNVRYGVGILPPEGFTAEVEGELKNSFYEGSDTGDTITYQVALRSTAATESSQVMEVGQPSALRIGDIGWEAGLGRMSNGSPAGFIQITAKDLTPEIYTPTGVGVHVPAHNPGEFDLIYHDLDADGVKETIRQIRAAQCLVDFVTLSPTSYEIRYYRSGTFDSGTNLYTPAGGTLVTYAVSKSAATAFTISRTDAWGTITSTAASTVDGTVKDWDLTISGGAYVKRTTANNTALTNGRQEDITTWYSSTPSGLPAAATKSFNIRRVYKNIAPSGTVQMGEKLVSQTHNAGETGLERTEKFSYWESASDYGLMKYREGPFGDWNLYSYEDLFYTGGGQTVIHNFIQWSKSNRVYGAVSALIPRQRRLIIDFAPETDALNFDIDTTSVGTVQAGYNAGSVRMRELGLAYGWDEFEAKTTASSEFFGVSGSRKYIARDFGSVLTFPLDYSATGPNNNFIELKRTYDTPDMATFNGSGGDGGITYSSRYVPSPQATGFDKRLSFKPYASISPDGVKKSYGYAKTASYEGIADAWVEVEMAGVQNPRIDDSQPHRIISVKSATTGNTFNADKSQLFFFEMAGRLLDPFFDSASVRNTVYADASTRYANPGNVSHGGVIVRMDAVQLVAGKSTKSVRAYTASGQLAREERWAYDSASQWKLIETVISEHDAFGRITSATRHDGVSGSQRVIREAHYDGLMLSWEKDAKGVRTDYLYDGIGRLSSKTVSSGHGLASIPAAVAMVAKLDAMDHVVELATGGLVESVTYDAYGLVLQKTDKNGLTTDYAYSRASGAGLRVDITYPGGGTETRIHFRNGRLKSISGSSVIAKNFTYSYDHGTNGTGNLFTRTDAVLTSGSSTRHPYGISRRDWNGRLVREESTSPVSQNFVRSFTYNPLTTRLDETLETEVSANGSSTTQSLAKKFGYNEMGFASVAGTDVDGSGLANASTDRLSRIDASFVSIDGNLYEQNSTTTYPEDGSATGVTVLTKSKLNGLGSSVLSQTIVEDIHGNSSTTTTTVDRATATVNAVTSYGDATSDSSTTVMGFPTATVSRQGRTITAAYDGAGRISLNVTSTGERSFSTRTEYESGKARAWKITTGLAADGSGSGYPTTYGYDSGGRVSSVLDAKGGTTFHGYNPRHQLVKSWGGAVNPIWYEYDADYGTLSAQHTWNVMAGSAPDLGAASSPPAGSLVARFVRDNASGTVTQRTDAFGSSEARVTDYTYDAVGNVRTVQTPSSTAGTNSVATGRITVTRQYLPKTGELSSITYSGGSAPSLAYTWHRSGGIKTVTEGGGFTRTFNYDHGGNGTTALNLLSEDLPSYYSTIPELASNDTGFGNSANRINRSYTTSGILGSYAGSASGVSAGGLSGLSATRGSMSLAWAGGVVDAVGFDGVTLDYGYEGGSAMPNRRSVAGVEETRQFEPNRDLLSWIKTTGGSAVRLRAGYTHDELGRRDTASQSGSVLGLYGGNLFSDLGYDDRGRLTSHESHAGTSAGAPPLPGRSFGYNYDLANNRRVASRPGAPATSFDWSVNALNQITSRQTPQWSEVSGMAPKQWGIALLPPPGDLAVAPSRTGDFFHAYHTTPASSSVRKAAIELLYAERSRGAADAAHPPHRKDLLDRRNVDLNLRPPAEVLKYDGRGNLANDAWWTYSWDGADRLTAIESSAAAITAGFEKVKLTFKYDWLGRRYAKQSHPWSGSAFAANPDKVTLYWWDDSNLIREATYHVSAWSGSNPTAATFVSETRYHWALDLSGTLGGAGGAGGLVGISTRLADQAAAAPLFPIYDGGGNVSALLDAAGNVQAAYEYDPYGRLLRSAGPAAESNPFRFATKYYDKETKLVYHDARYYSPELGRFISRDPILESGGTNLYAYTGNNPSNAVDVLGHISFFYAGGGMGGFSGGGWSGGGGTSWSSGFSFGFSGLGGSSSSSGWTGSSRAMPIPDAWSARNIAHFQEVSAAIPDSVKGGMVAVMQVDNGRLGTLLSVMMRDPTLEATASFGKGAVWDGLGGTLGGLWDMVSDPAGTVAGMGSALYNYQDTWKGLKAALGDYGGRLATGDPAAFGQGAFEVAALFVAPAKAGEASKLRYLSKTDEVVDLARMEGAAGKVGAELAEEGAGLIDDVARTWCFVAGTKIKTPEGDKSIEQLIVGDRVITHDSGTGEEKMQVVLQTFHSWTDEVYDIEIGDEVLSTTGSHRFWLPDEKLWIAAKHLKVGQILLGQKQARFRIDGISIRPNFCDVYNLEVGSDHNYFAGRAGVLVHNGDVIPFDDFNQARNGALQWLEGRGFKAESQVMGKFGSTQGRPIGMSTADGRVGFRVEFDARSGAHINVWDHNAPKGVRPPHFTFNGNEKTVMNIHKHFFCK